MSLGNTSASTSYELDAFNQNPANLILQRSNNKASAYFNIITNLGVHASSKFLSLDFYNNYFTKDANGNTRTLSDQNKSNIFNEVSNQPSDILISSKLLAVVLNTKKIGSFGFSIDERFTGNFKASKDLLNIALYGNISNSLYDFSQTELNAFWTRELNLSYANKVNTRGNKFFNSLTYGVSVKPQFGLYYLKTQSNNLTVSTNNFNVIQSSGNMELVYSGLTSNNDLKYSPGNAGFGVGFDAGVNARIKNVSRYGSLNIGLSITDLGFIKWTKNDNKYFYDGNFVITDITNKAQIDSLRDRIKGSKTPIPDFSVSLPATLRLGISFKLFDSGKKDSLSLERGTLAVDYIQNLNENLGSSLKSIVGFGVEVNLTKVLSPRIGFAIGGRDNFVATMGLGIDTGPVLIDLGTYNIGSIFTPKATTKFSAGLNIKFKVN